MTRPHQTPTPGPALDEIVTHTALRGIAALCVVLYHVSLACKPHLPAALQGFIAHSYLCVDLFFALSGYILGRKYSDVFGAGIAGPDLRRFAVLRFARLYPNYLFWFLMALGLAMALALRNAAPPWPPGSSLSAFQHLTATQGLFSASRQWNIPLWSIGVEFLLYALLPLILRGLFLTRRGGEVLCLVAGLAILLALSSLGGIDIITGGASLLRGVASFAIGVVIARHGQRPAGLSERLLAAWQVLALASSVVLVALGQEILALLAFYALIGASQFNAGPLYRLACHPLARLLGTLSYSVYLSHAVILQIALLIWYKIADAPSKADFFALALLTLGLALIAAKLAHDRLERPAQRWLTRLLLPDDPVRKAP